MMTIYHAQDGTITIQWPKCVIPNRETIEKACEIIKAIRRQQHERTEGF